MTSYDYLIVGGGMAADTAARGIRELDSTGSIGILSADVDGPYTRPALSKKLWTDPEFEWDQVPLGTVDDTGATLHLETIVTAIDRDDRTVSTSDGDEYGYDKLLLAMGGKPNRAGLPDDDRIIAFRSAADYRRLRAAAGEGVHVAVVGGSYIASEIAAALIQNDTKVSLIFPDDVLLASMLPADLADRFDARYRAAGIDMHPGKRVSKGRVTSEKVELETDDGSIVAADLVVLGLGVSPVTDFAEEAGLEVSDGIVVDEHLRTADEHIWATGDIANYPDPILGRTRVEHVDNARAMGTAAGRILAGDTTPYTHTPWFYSNVFEFAYKAIGEVDSSMEMLEDWITPQEKGAVWYLEGEKPVGVLLWDMPDAVEHATAVLGNPPEHRDGLVGILADDA